MESCYPQELIVKITLPRRKTHPPHAMLPPPVYQTNVVIITTTAAIAAILASTNTALTTIPQGNTVPASHRANPDTVPGNGFNRYRYALHLQSLFYFVVINTI